MPTWQPIWDDVYFDYGAAEEAISNCQGCLAFMEQREYALAPAREQATHEWRGRYRKEFDEENIYLQHLAREVVEQLYEAIRHIRAEIDAANAEETFRIRERQRWLDELRAEHARDEQLASNAASSAPIGSSANGVIRLS
jgi:hypothetical protein